MTERSQSIHGDVPVSYSGEVGSIPAGSSTFVKIKLELLSRSWRVHYANRDGKIYARLKYIGKLPNPPFSVGELTIREYFPYAFLTSGGGGTFVYRLNPDKNIMEAIDRYG